MKHSAWFALIAIIACALPAWGDDFDSAGVKIHYTITGQGDPVILIHGLYSSGAMNWDLPGITAELAKSHEVITFDLRGHGKSDKPAGESAYGVEMSEDVLRLMDHLHIAKAKIAGYSLGGMIAMKFVVMHPDRVTSAVLGGMGWLRQGGYLQRVWEDKTPRNTMGTPVACVNAIANLAVTRDQVLAIKVPMTVLVGDRDPTRVLYVKPLEQLRPDIPVHVITGAGHIECVTKPEFKEDLAAALK